MVRNFSFKKSIGVFLILGFFIFVAEASDNSTVNYGANSNITAHTVCKKVTNDSATGLSVYVPTQTSGEWSSFYTNPPAGVTAGSCAPACVGGTMVGGYCWYLGSAGQTCTTVCASRGGYNEATRTYAGSGGSMAQCQAVLSALGAQAAVPGIYQSDGYARGCVNVRKVYSGTLLRRRAQTGPMGSQSGPAPATISRKRARILHSFSCLVVCGYARRVRISLPDFVRAD